MNKKNSENGKEQTMLNEKDVLSIFKQMCAIQENDHFVYASGYHGDTYVAKEMLFLYPEITWVLCEEMAGYCAKGWEIDCTVGPERGGIILAQWVGYHLSQSTGRQILSVPALKAVHTPLGKSIFTFLPEHGKMIAGKNIVIVEDVINTGKTVQDIALLVNEYGGNMQGVVALWNRGNARAYDLRPIPKLFALLNISFARWPAASCLLCEKKVPVNLQFGHGKEFLAAKH